MGDPFTPVLREVLATKVAYLLDVDEARPEEGRALATQMAATPNHVMAMAITQMIHDQLQKQLPKTHPFFGKKRKHDLTCLVFTGLQLVQENEAWVRRQAAEEGFSFHVHVGHGMVATVAKLFRNELP